MLGFVSMSARNNRYFRHVVSSYLDGKEAARVVRGVRVMIGGVERLEWRKVYDK